MTLLMDVRSLSEANDLHPNDFDSCREIVVEDGNWKRASEYESCFKTVAGGGGEESFLSYF